MYIKVYQSYRKLSAGSDMQSMALIQLTFMNFEFSLVKAGLRKYQNICETKYPPSRNSLPIEIRLSADDLRFNFTNPPGLYHGPCFMVLNL